MAYSPHLSMKTSSIFSGAGDDVDDLCVKCDKYCAKAMDAIIESLAKPHSNAIKFSWLGTGGDWPTHAMDLEDAYVNIGVMADRRGLV